MTHRRLLVLLSVLLVALLLTIPVAGQAPAAGAKAQPAAKAYKAPRTPDGQPDLQGYWTNSTYVPLERPNGVTKEFYTPEEAAAVAKRGADRDAEQTVPGTTGDVHYDFTQFGLDRSQNPFAASLRTSQIVDPADGKVPPLTAEAQKRTAGAGQRGRPRTDQYDAVQNMPVGSRCIVMNGSGPPLQSAGYNANYQIVQGAGAVMILTEMIHDARVIPLDGRPHRPNGVNAWSGDSVGRWEGETLVVETTNFGQRNPFRGASNDLRVIERFTRTAEDTIKYQFTIEDEKTWTRPWTAELPMAKSVGPIFEFACHETNYGIANILAGAREDEKRAAAARKTN